MGNSEQNFEVDKNSKGDDEGDGLSGQPENLHSSSSFDSRYQETPDYFGKDPDDILNRYYSRLDKSLPVLDIGCGQGRNSIYLARQDFAVHAIDPSLAAIEALNKIIQKESLNIFACQADYTTFNAPYGNYNGILVFGLIPLLSPESIRDLITCCTNWINPKGYIFVTAFTTDDDSYTRYKKESKAIDTNSFLNNVSGEIRTFLSPGEILSLFTDWDVIDHWEGMGQEHRHGNGPLHRHAMCQLVAQFNRNT